MSVEGEGGLRSLTYVNDRATLIKILINILADLVVKDSSKYLDK